MSMTNKIDMLRKVTAAVLLSWICLQFYSSAAISDNNDKNNTMGFFSRLIPQSDIPTSATQPVPKGSRNSIRTTWTAPSSVTTAQQAAADVHAAFSAYPQEGQAGVDKGGWKLVDGSFETGTVRVEFTSAGNGWLARLLNGGKGFVDDVLVELVADNPGWRAEVRSSSRMGKSDLGVNQKRLVFLANQMSQQGWEAPKPEYP